MTVAAAVAEGHRPVLVKLRYTPLTAVLHVLRYAVPVSAILSNAQRIVRLANGPSGDHALKIVALVYGLVVEKHYTKAITAACFAQFTVLERTCPATCIPAPSTASMTG